MNDADTSRSTLTVVVPGDRPDVHGELLRTLAGEPVRVILDRRRVRRSSGDAIARRTPHDTCRRTRVPDHVGTSRPAIIVSPDNPERYDFVTRHLTDGSVVDVLYDRRHAGRRVVSLSVAHDRRRADRRRQDLGPDLRAVGWAVAHLGPD